MLKNVLSLLLSKFYSKKESALVASLALPDKSVSTSVSVTGGRDEYVAPSDGYLEFVTTVTNNGINVYGQVLQTSSYPREGRAAKLFVPIAKGKKIIFEVAADTSVTFYALVGGVQTLKKLLLQGGGLCLNSLSSSLRRSSWLARRRAFRTGHILTSVIALPFQFLRERLRLNTLLQGTELSRPLSGTAPQLGSIPQNLRLPIHPQLLGCTSTICKDGIATFIGFRKEERLFLPSRNLIPVVGLLSSRSTNSAVGGASC